MQLTKNMSLVVARALIDWLLELPEKVMIFMSTSRLLPDTLKAPQIICLGTSHCLNMMAPGGWLGGWVLAA